MITNADMTIYNKYFDKASRMDKYKRHSITNVFWDDVEGASRLRSGLEQSDKVLVIVPFESYPEGSFIGFKGYSGEEGTFTFQVGDRIVKNVIGFDIDNRPAELDKRYLAYTITSIDRKDFGSSKMHHWEIRGK